MNKKIFASALLCGVACGGTFQSSSKEGTGGASGQAGAAGGHGGTGASAGTAAGGGSAGSGASAGHGGSGGIGIGGSGASAGVGAGGSGGAGGGVGGTAGGAGGATCGPNCGFTCCGTECINTHNDIKNCGACGNVCPGPNPYCDGVKCGTPPCQGMTCAAGTTCCEFECCKAGQLCCEVSNGTVGITCTTPTSQGTCPAGCAQCVCTAPNTPIATPSGERAISELKVGDLVYSVHRGQLKVVPIILINRVPVTGSHHMVEVRLSTGSVLSISPSHPTADGRTFADLAAGDRLDDVALASVRRVPYTEAYTYDILPDSDSGAYFAGGVLIGTTLAPPPLINQSEKPIHAWVSR